jgi:hypothetical protein
MVAFTWHSGSDNSRESRVASVPETPAAVVVPIPRHRRRRAAAVAIDWELPRTAVVVMGLTGVVLIRPANKEAYPTRYGLCLNRGLAYCNTGR